MVRPDEAIPGEGKTPPPPPPPPPLPPPGSRGERINERIRQDEETAGQDEKTVGPLDLDDILHPQDETVAMSLPAKDPFAEFEAAQESPSDNRIQRLRTATVTRVRKAPQEDTGDLDDDILGAKTEVFEIDKDPRVKGGIDPEDRPSFEKTLQEIPNAAHILGSTPKITLDILENPEAGFLKELRMMIFDACLTSTLQIVKKVKFPKGTPDQWEDEFLNLHKILAFTWEKLEDSGENFQEALDALIHNMDVKEKSARIQKIKITIGERKELLADFIQKGIIERLQNLKTILASIGEQFEENTSLVKMNLGHNATVSMYEQLPTILSGIKPETSEDQPPTKLEERYYEIARALIMLFGEMIQKLTYDRFRPKVRRMSAKLKIQKITTPQAGKERPVLNLADIKEDYVCTFLGIDNETIRQLKSGTLDASRRREVTEIIESQKNQWEFIKCLEEVSLSLEPEMIIGKKIAELINFVVQPKKLDTMVGVTRGEMQQGLTQIRTSPAVQKLDILRGISEPDIPELQLPVTIPSVHWPLIEDESADHLFRRIGSVEGGFTTAMLDRLWNEFKLDIPYQE